jgi:hypothetical protein
MTTRECGAESASGCPSAPWPDNPLGRRRVDGEQAGRADGASDELAAALRTDPVQDVLRAVPAPGALVCADKHVRGCRVEVPVAAFAIRPQLQHMSSIGMQRRLEQAPVPISTVVAVYVEASQTADLPLFGWSGCPAQAGCIGSTWLFTAA